MLENRNLVCVFGFAALAASGIGGASALADPGYIYTIAGTGDAGYSGDAGPATTATLRAPGAVALGTDGSAYIADTANHVVRRVSPSGSISTSAGTGIAGFSGEGSQATTAQLRFPAGLAIDSSGRLHISDTANNRIRRIEPNGSITTVAGDGTAGASGDGTPATAAALKNPWGITFDAAGNLYIADEGNNRIRRVSAVNGIISTVAGNGQVGAAGDGGPATAARLTHASGVALDAQGNLYIADKGNNRVRMVDSGGTISTFAGSTAGNSGDGGPAIEAQLGNVFDVLVGLNDVVYLSDNGNHRIRQITPDGTISTFAGSTRGYSGDNGPSAVAQLRQPSGLGLDSAGRVWIVDEGNEALRRVDSTCGNGSVDQGEECDALNANGLPGSCCLSSCQLRAADEICRGAVDACDIAELCTGSSSTCPTDSVEPDSDGDEFCDPIDVCPLDLDPLQLDGDNDGTGDACDACTNSTAAFAHRHRVVIGRVSGPVGEQSLSAKGRILPFPTSPAIDPVANGARVVLTDADGGVLMDALIPAGAWNPVTRRGWSVRYAAGGFSARFLDSATSAPPAGGIRKLSLVARDGEGLTLVQIEGRQGNYAITPGQAPIRLVLSLAPNDPSSDQCGEFLFDGPGSGCQFTHRDSTLSCG